MQLQAIRRPLLPERSRDHDAEQGDEADEAFGGTNPRAASGARPEVPPNARAVSFERGHRFAAYPRCWADQEECDAGTADRANSRDAAGQPRVRGRVSDEEWSLCERARNRP